MQRDIFSTVSAAFEAVGQMVAVLDADYRIVDASPAFRGVAPSAVVEGRSVGDFVESHTAERRIAALPGGVFDERVKYIIALEIQNATQRSADERERVREALEHHRWRRSAAARSLGISRATLWRRMREFGLL
jgi:transcriptional regulator with AAA-type ATPase domain